MTVGWKHKRLGEVCNIAIGKTPSRGSKSYWDAEKSTDNVWLSIADLLNTDGNVVSDSKEYLTDKGATLCKTVKAGTLLASFKLTLGRLAFAGRDLYTNEAIASLVIKDESELSKTYLYHYLDHFDWDSATGGDVKLKGKTLNKQKLNEIPVYYPTSLTEQQRIVTILDQAFEGIAAAKANAEKNLANAREVFESYIHEIFENKGKKWQVRALGDVCEFSNGQAHEQHIDENGDYVLVNSKFISSEGVARKRTNKLLSPLFEGDVVFVMSDVPNGKALAKCFLVDRNDTYTLNQRICVIRSKNYEKKFLFYNLNRNKFLLSFNNGENQTNLRKNDILNCPLLLPTIDEQVAVVKKLDMLSAEIKNLEAIYQQKFDALEELKKSILNQAFSGQLN